MAIERMLLSPLMAALSEGEAELVKRLHQRDAQALADLYDRYGRLAYSVILRIVHNGATAEDLVQETFLRVWKHARAFDAEKGALGPWLLAVARYRAIDYLRSGGGRDCNALKFEMADHFSLSTDMESTILEADNLKTIRAAVERLSPNQQQVIKLAYFEGLTQTEMAERMGQPLGTVKTWARTALKRLREELAGAAPA